MREDGHYYVRYGGKWDIARWSEGYGWKTFDWTGYHKDSAFEKIDERKIDFMSDAQAKVTEGTAPARGKGRYW